MSIFSLICLTLSIYFFYTYFSHKVVKNKESVSRDSVGYKSRSSLDKIDDPVVRYSFPISIVNLGLIYRFTGSDFSIYNIVNLIYITSWTVILCVRFKITKFRILLFSILFMFLCIMNLEFLAQKRDMYVWLMLCVFPIYFKAVIYDQEFERLN